MALLSIQVAAAALFILARPSILATELRKQQRQLVDITHAGDDADPSVFPLQECQSDCDSDWDCEFGLICFQRAGDEEVSNCGGTPQTAFDYCVQPSENQLVIAGNNGLGSWPLKECQGDCDTDDECEGLLKCFQRNANEAVPGCEGTGDDLGSDYCYNDGTSVDPTVSSSTLDPTGDPTLDPTDPTDPSNGGDDGDDGNCDSDCNSDWDCEFGEVCVQRVDANKPGCSNTEASGIVIGYCITPNIPNLLVIAGNNGDGTSPLQKCQVSWHRRRLTLLDTIQMVTA